MPYNPVVWVNDVTPLDAVHLNQMDQGILSLDGGKVDRDSIVSAATRLVQTRLSAADAQMSFQINGDGLIRWGPGGAGALDTNLLRIGPGFLGSNNPFARIYSGSGGELRVGFGFDPAGTATAPATHTSIYYDDAVSTAVLASLSGGVAWRNWRVANASFFADAHIVAFNGAAGRVGIGGNGPGGEAGVVFSNLGDTNLYRYTAGLLKTDTVFMANTLVAGSGGAPGVVGMQIEFGYANSRLYRQAIKTEHDGATAVGNAIDFYCWTPADVTGDVAPSKRVLRLRGDGTALAAGFIAASFGSASGVYLGNLTPFLGAANAAIMFGEANDTFLYRSGVNALTCSGTFHAIGGVSLLSGTDTVDLRGELVRMGANIKALKLRINGADYKIDLKPA